MFKCHAVELGVQTCTKITQSGITICYIKPTEDHRMQHRKRILLTQACTLLQVPITALHCSQNSIWPGASSSPFMGTMLYVIFLPQLSFSVSEIKCTMPDSLCLKQHAKSTCGNELLPKASRSPGKLIGLASTALVSSTSDSPSWAALAISSASNRASSSSSTWDFSAIVLGSTVRPVA